MNRWVAVGLVIVFLLLVLVTVLFGGEIKQLEILSSDFFKTKVSSLPSKTDVVTPTQDVARISVVADNLEIPWGLVFLPDKSIVFTERPGRVRLIDSNGNIRNEPIATISEVFHIGEGGLLGIAIHPQFIENNFIYLYYTYSGNGDDTLNRVVRYRLQNNSLVGKKIIVDNIPGAANHNGGRIKFGPDGFLYIATGDSQKPSFSQDKSSLAGKFLRVDSDGNPASGNPFGTVIYSYGHRNPQGLAWDNNGRLWATEHGRSGVLSGFDELNLIEKGKNYGWSIIQGDQKREDMVTPVINSGATTTWAPSGMAYFDGSLYFGGLRGEGLYKVIISGDKVSNLRKFFDHELGRIRDVVLGPDDMLYITTSNRDGRGASKENDDKIYKINPRGL